jgi:DNA repair protein RadC
MSFKDLPAEARPREKLLARGAAALGDAELLALLLRTGLAGKNVLQLAQELLDTFGGIAGSCRPGSTTCARSRASAARPSGPN